MRYALVLALTVVVAWAAFADPRVPIRTCDPTSRRSDRGGVACGNSLAPMTLMVNSSALEGMVLPDPHITSTGIGECHFVAAGTANGCDTVCTQQDGGPLCDGAGGLVDPHTAACINTPWGKGYDITAASQAPVCDSNILRTKLADDGGTGPVTSYHLHNYRTAGSPTGDVRWVYDMFDGTGPNYRQVYDDGSGTESGAIGFWCSPGGDRSTNEMRDGWALSGCAYTGGSGAGALVVRSQISSTSTTNVSRGAFHSGSKLTIGANDAHNGTRYYLNGTIAHLSWFEAQEGTTTYLTDRQMGVMGVRNPSRLLYTPAQSVTVQGQTIDWTAYSGNVENFNTPTPLYDPVSGGLRTFADYRNTATASDNLDLSSMTSVGAPTINANTSSGWMNAWKRTDTVDELVCGVANCGKRTTERFNNWDGGYEPSWYTATAGAKQGLTGATRDSLTIKMITDGTMLGEDAGTTGVCNFTGIGATEYAAKCTVKVTGATTVKWDYLVPAIGSIQLEIPQSITGPHAEPPYPTNVARPSTHYTFDATALPSFTNGACVETTFRPLESSDKYTLGFPTNGGTLYLVDMKGATDHAGMFLIANYPATDGGSGVGNLLCGARADDATPNDLEDDGNNYTAGTEYAYACCIRKHTGGGWDMYMYYNACTGVLPDGGQGCTRPGRDAVTLVKSVTNGSKNAPVNATTGYCNNRFNSVVPGSVGHGACVNVSVP